MANGYSLPMRKTREEIRHLVQHERKLKTRLQLATTRLEEAERERIWAIVAARNAGLSIRNIAVATGLSRSRIHQLLHDREAHDIPEWLTHLRDRERDADTTDQATPDASIRARIASEVEVLRWCINWLEQLERGEMVVANLRPDTDDHTEFVRFDHARVLRVLTRITSDLDALARQEPEAETENPEANADPRTRHRQRLAEPEEKPLSCTAKAQRNALRKAFGLPY